MTSLERIKKLVELQNLFNRKQEIVNLYKEQEQKLARYNHDIEVLDQTLQDLQIYIKEMDQKINEELGKRDEINTRIENLDESKDKIRIARQIKSWEKEMERMQQELSLIQAQIDYDTSKQLELKNEYERVTAKINENKDKIAELEQEITRIKNEHQQELEDIESKSQKIRDEFGLQFMDYFESMLHKTNGNAIVVVENEACSGCNVILPTQLQGDLGEEIATEDIELHQCPHCFRYLYYHSWLERVEVEQT